MKILYYALRHSLASLLLAGGLDLKTVSQALGHSTISVTADVYAHVSPAMLHDATMSNRRVCGLALLAPMLCWVGCSVGSSRTGELPGSPAIVRQAVAPTSTAEPFLYVGGWKLSMFALGSTTPLRSTKTPDMYLGLP
jgi:hypothetical protein